MTDLLGEEIPEDTKLLVSLNRYERKKNIGLAIQAVARLKGSKGKLVIAGGYDERVTENVEHDQELQALAEKEGISVIFLRSISNDERLLLLEHTTALLYTPENEHFGIVPVEAMYMGAVVVACNSGGPTESVAHGETGYLLSPDADEWSR